MTLKNKEKFVAEIIKCEFSKKYSNVSYIEGEDPPDIYFNFDSKKAAIELTELSPNLQNNRISIDKSYEWFFKSVKIDIKVPDHTHYFIVFHHANIKLNRKRKKEIRNFLESPNAEMKKCINGIYVRIKSIRKGKKLGTLSHMSSNMNSCSRDINSVSASLMDSNIEGSFNLIINKAIETKKEKCKNINKPIWLAMHDSYFSYFFSESKDECNELYKKIMRNIDFGVFEKIIITFNDKGIMVFDRNPHNKTN